MKKTQAIFVWQRDARMQAAAHALEAAGWQVLAPAAAAQCPVWLLPVPLTGQEPDLPALFAQARPGTQILCGHPSAAVQALPRAPGVELVDYAAWPALAEWNAIPTAEGCLSLLMTHTRRTLGGEQVLVGGFGRVARALAVRLLALGAVVTVAARSPLQRAQAACMGCRPRPIEALDGPTGCPVVVNTVPARVLAGDRLRQLPPGALVIELASPPGGMDPSEARAAGLTVLQAPGLPGRYAPETAGVWIARTVQELLQERGMQDDAVEIG